jgi:di/tripeptidase
MNNIRYLRDYLADMYIEMESNSFTVEIFSEYYGLDEEDGENLLNLAKKCYEQRVDFIKDMEEV